MSSSEVGSGHVAILPQFKGFRRQVTDEVDSSAKAGKVGFARVWKGAGAAAGSATGKEFGKGFTSSTKGVGAAAAKKLGAEVASASRAVSAARLKEQDATGKVRVAEAQLTEARAKNVAGSARLVAAEERAASAARALASAQSTTQAASARLKDAQAGVATATTNAGNASSRSSRGFRQASTALSGLQGAAGGVSRLFGAGLGLGVGLVAAASLGRAVGRLTGYVRESIATAAQWQTLNAQTAAVIKSTGGAANVTAGRISSLSQRLENSTATEMEAIQQGANLLLTFKGIRNEAGRGNKIFDQTTAAAVDMARAMGISVPAAALQLGKALNDPAQGLSKLTRVGVTFTDGQTKQVKALVAAGRTMDAQKIILRELNSEFGGSGKAYANTYAGALYRIKDAAGDFGASIASVALPAITKLLSTGADLINWASSTGVVQDVSKSLATSLGRIADRLKTFLGGLSQADFTAFAAKAQGAFDQVKSIVGSVVSTVGPLMLQIGPSLASTFAAIGPSLSSAFQTLGPVLAQVIPQLASAAKDILPALADVIVAIAPALPPLAQAIAALAPIVVFLVQNALVPLIQSLAGMIKLVGLIVTGGFTIQTAIDGMNGKFGLMAQIVSIAGASLGAVIGSIILGVRTMAAAVGAAITGVIGFFGRMASDVGAAIGRAVAGLLSFAARGIEAAGRLASGIGSAIGRAVAFVAGLPGRALAALGDVGSKLYGSGARLIGGFVDGIRSAIGQITRAVSDAMAAAGSFFPHSPAKKGAFSGKGWTPYSGKAVGDGFASGIVSSTPRISRAAAAATRAAQLVSTTGASTNVASVSSSSGGQFVGNLYLDSGEFMGKVRGEVQAGISTATSNSSRTARRGKQGPAFG